MTLWKWAVPALGIIGITGFLRIRGRARKPRRPTTEQLLNMSDDAFEAQVRAWGLKTVTSLGLARHEGGTD